MGGVTCAPECSSSSAAPKGDSSTLVRTGHGLCSHALLLPSPMLTAGIMAMPALSSGLRLFLLELRP
jgi:hypothetical protein